MKNIKNNSIVISPGEPSGIGPDLVIFIAQESWPVELVICSDPVVLIERARKLNVSIDIRLYDPDRRQRFHTPGRITVLEHVKISQPVIAGKLNVANGGYVIENLSRACLGCLKKEFSSLLTGPIHKSVVNKSGISFHGHTEFLTAMSVQSRSVMMLMNRFIRVALVTTHLPLREVPKSLTERSLREVITILIDDLRFRFGILRPKIYVCGLNPHAGENGYLGREEIDIISPVLNSFRRKGNNLIGPLPADSIFQDKYLHDADAILAMYHDQGIPVVKSIDFDHTVNVTLGLPFIRASVGHGTALELAGRGMANITSMKTALNLIIQLMENEKKYKNSALYT